MILESLKNPVVKHLLLLRKDGAYRQKCQSALIVGANMIRELCADIKLKMVVLPPDYPLDFELNSSRILLATPKIIKKIAGVEEYTGPIAEIALPKPIEIRGEQKLLLLDRVADPGNMGTLLRSALALGWEGAIITPGCVDPFNDKALRSSKGAPFHLPLFYKTPQEIMALEYNIFVADMHGPDIKKTRIQKPCILVLSNEARGNSPWTAPYPKICIPLKDKAESLNVAAAGAILMYLIG